MDYTKWDTIENWKLTNRGEKEVEAFIRECKAKRKEIMDAGIDTACHTHIPTNLSRHQLWRRSCRRWI